MIPAFHRQGTNLKPPPYTANNAIQSVSPYNTQMPQVLPQPLFGQHIPNDNKVNRHNCMTTSLPTSNNPCTYNKNQHYHRMSSTSEDETDSNKNTWQKVNIIKKKEK
jgi:hypothetical protein